MSNPRHVSDAERKLWTDTGYVCDRDHERVERLSATIAALLEALDTLLGQIQLEENWQDAEEIRKASTLAAEIRGGK